MSRHAGRALEAMLRWNPGAERPHAPLGDLQRADYGWAAITGVISAALFATVLSSHPGLSDASESVAGVASLGILHAPGYPSYVLIGRLVTSILPFGDMAFRVGLFSLLCASLSVTLVQLLARRCGVPRWAASLGALTLAAGAGFWFYAGFAKHDQLSGLCFLLSLYLLLGWESKPTRRRLVGVALVTAVGLGSSWPLMLMLAPTLLYVLARSRRKLTAPALATGALAGILVLTGAYGFVIVRAGENPALNWGHASNVGALVTLIERSDFAPPAARNTGAAHAPISLRGSVPPNRPPAPSGQSGGFPTAAAAGSSSASGLLAYLEMFWRELGPLGFLTAGWGAISSLFWRRNAASIPLLLTFAVNLFGAVLTVSPEGSSYNVDLVEEGFILGCYFALACWIAIGAADLVGRVRVPRLRVAGRLSLRGLRATAGAVIAAVALVPLVIAGWSVAHRSDNAYADSYAETVFSELPPDAVLLVAGSDLNLPLSYRQIVYHERRDVVVVSLGGLRYPWYRREVRLQLGEQAPIVAGDPAQDARQLVRWLRGTRPVYADEQATEYLRGMLGFQTAGLVSRIVPGTRQAPAGSPATLEKTLVSAERKAGLPSADWRVWPNVYLQQNDYVSAGLKAASFYYREHDLPGMAAALRNVTRIDPGDPTATKDLSLLESSSGKGGA